MELAGPKAKGRLQVIEGDIRCCADLERAFAGAASTGAGVDAVIHFAGLKAVGESVTAPLRYWDVNVTGSRQLLAAMAASGCRTLVFSSSATLYGYPETAPIPESAPIRPINPYGYTKAAVEQMLDDIAASEVGWRIACLPALFQPGGRTSERPHRRRPQRHSQQPISFHQLGCCGPTRACAGVRWRLAHTRWKWCAGLHPCH